MISLTSLLAIFFVANLTLIPVVCDNSNLAPPDRGCDRRALIGYGGS